MNISFDELKVQVIIINNYIKVNGNLPYYKNEAQQMLYVWKSITTFKK